MKKQIQTPAQETIDAFLYAFQQNWNWFVAHGLVLRQNISNGEWIVEKRLILSIGTNTPASCREALKRHGVTIEEQENCLKAIFPEHTRRVPQSDLPGTFLLILPDGWQCQEMPVHKHRNLPYTSILVPLSSEEPAGALWTVGRPGEPF